MRAWAWGILGLSLLAVAAPAIAACPVDNLEGRRRVVLGTEVGDVCIELLDRPGEAPLTVENFVNYIQDGDYDGTFFHRSVTNTAGTFSIVQAGGFTWNDVDGYAQVPTDPPVVNEPGISNQRGTVAMAKLGGLPNSATSQWFLNVVDNSGPPASLDTQNGGFTVFARVVPEDMDTVDALAALRTESGQIAVMSPLAPNFTNLPVLELLERDPAGYGCLIVCPDPLSDGSPLFYDPVGDLCGPDILTCSTQPEVNEAVTLTVAALDPQVPERLVMMTPVPEPAPSLLAAVGAAVLGAARRWWGPRRVG